ncbi:MAG TPA: MBOAT family O-acyltransferase [Acidimicrobiales bacterium]|nr:MBOAT family O-acyltransferase [Acidimicrobiales bacterium]
MLFPTIRFAIFFMGTWTSFVATRDHPRARRVVLLGASWFFYASWDWRFLALLWWMILTNHVAARIVAATSTPASRRRALAAGVAMHLGLLGYFKYYGFFTESLVDLFARLDMAVSVPLVQVVLPLGISFLTFQSISYLVEVKRGVVDPVPLLDEAVWLSFFPTVVSGPITRVSELVPQLDVVPVCTDHSGATLLILRGLFKKVVVASFLAATIVEDAFATPTQFSGPELLFALYAFGALVYVDFSGYTDMARGLASLLGFHLPENFDAPYRASTVQEFWTRWHMTLTRWLRDFLFTPLGLRFGRRRHMTLAIPIIVMLIAGLWHGAAWTFVAFGGIHGLALAVERWQRERRRRLGLGRPPHSTWRRIGRYVVTLHVITLGWLFFRAESFGSAWTILDRIATAPGGVDAVSLLAFLTVVAVFAVQFLPAAWTNDLRDTAIHLGPVPQVIGAAFALSAIDILGPPGVSPFIYFQF